MLTITLTCTCAKYKVFYDDIDSVRDNAQTLQPTVSVQKDMYMYHVPRPNNPQCQYIRTCTCIMFLAQTTHSVSTKGHVHVSCSSPKQPTVSVQKDMYMYHVPRPNNPQCQYKRTCTCIMFHDASTSALTSSFPCWSLLTSCSVVTVGERAMSEAVVTIRSFP